MRSLILGIAALPMLAIAAPAAAQYYQNNQYQYTNQGNSNLSVRIDQLRERLQAGVQNRSISRREAAPIHEQIRQIDLLERQYRVNGLSGQEQAYLQQRIRLVRQQLRVADNGAGGRYAHWDREDGYGQSYQQPYPQGYGYQQQPYPQGYGQGYQQPYGQGYQQPYQQGYGQGYQQPVQQGGLAGIVSQLLGIGGLQVGQRAPTNLYGVPYALQNQYRDGNGVYYRSDGQRIYQIDARTQTVIRIFGM